MRWILCSKNLKLSSRQKGAEICRDHLSDLSTLIKIQLENKEITETFPLETLGSVALGDDNTPWFADFVNYHAGNSLSMLTKCDPTRGTSRAEPHRQKGPFDADSFEAFNIQGCNTSMVKNCDSCQRQVKNFKRDRCLKIPSRLLCEISMTTFEASISKGPLPSSKANKYILVDGRLSVKMG
ncbi:hypothetical protein Tco_1351581 [Tanacetum coccineum]